VPGLVDAGIDGIKFHNLHIIHNTDLAREYAKNPFALLNEYEYAEALMELLRTIPSHIPILRLARRIIRNPSPLSLSVWVTMSIIIG
jgi:radical SAM superfamily enzyme